VAICEQVEDPQTAKGIVARVLSWKTGRWTAVESLHGGARRWEKPFGLAHLDLSTDEFRVTEIEEWEEVLDETGRIKPAEL
jgi:DNA mismatch repair protein MutS